MHNDKSSAAPALFFEAENSGTQNPDDAGLVALGIALQSRVGITDCDFGALSGTSQITWRLTKARRQLPKRSDVRERLLKFLAANWDAQRRGELRIFDR